MSTSTPHGPEAAALAARYDLPKLGGRVTLLGYLAQLWDRRHFTLELARSRFRAQNEVYRLGVAWVVLLPLINVAVYGLVFGVLVQNDSRPTHFVSFLVVGVFTFQFFSGCFTEGAKAITKNRGLVRTLHFPRAVLPISAVMQQVLVLVPTALVMCVIVLITGEPLTAHWFKLIPAYALMAMFCAGVAFIAARLTVHVRDITQIIPFVNRLLFYTSGIFFSVNQRFGDDTPGWLSTLLQVNPVSVYITLVRDALLHRDRDLHVQADAGTWQLGILYGVALFVIGFIFFWRAEGLYGRD